MFRFDLQHNISVPLSLLLTIPVMILDGLFLPIQLCIFISFSMNFEVC